MILISMNGGQNSGSYVWSILAIIVHSSLNDLRLSTIPSFDRKTAEHVGGFLTDELTAYISGIANRTMLISGCGHTPSTSTNSAEINTTIPPALYCQLDGASRFGCSEP